MLTRDPAAPPPPRCPFLPPSPLPPSLHRSGWDEGSICPSRLRGQEVGVSEDSDSACLPLCCCLWICLPDSVLLAASSTWRCRPPARQTGAGFHLSICSLLGPVHHASVGPGCQGQGRSLVFSSDRLLLGAREEWTEHTPSVPAPTPSRFCFTKLTVARSSPGPTSARSARPLFPLVLPWIAKVGRGACVGWAELGAGGLKER